MSVIDAERVFEDDLESRGDRPEDSEDMNVELDSELPPDLPEEDVDSEAEDREIRGNQRSNHDLPARNWNRAIAQPPTRG